MKPRQTSRAGSGRVRRHLTFANVTSVLALVLALGGGIAYAVERNSIGSGMLKRGAVKSSDIANDAVKIADLAPQTARALSMPAVTANLTDLVEMTGEGNDVTVLETAFVKRDGGPVSSRAMMRIQYSGPSQLECRIAVEGQDRSVRGERLFWSDGAPLYGEGINKDTLDFLDASPRLDPGRYAVSLICSGTPELYISRGSLSVEG